MAKITQHRVLPDLQLLAKKRKEKKINLKAQRQDLEVVISPRDQEAYTGGL